MSLGRFAVSLAAFLIGSGPAVAGPLLITPTTVSFEAGRRSAAIEITNQSDEPADLQFRAFAWSQDATGDRLEPTTALAVSPPIATLPPHGRQVFRVLAVDPSTPAGERSYRLKLNELPRPAKTSAIAINVEFSLPVFLTPKGAAATLKWGTAGTPATIELINRGQRRLRVSSLALHASDGTRTEIATASATYLLAGASRRFSLPAGGHVLPGSHLVGVSDAGPIDVPLATLAAR